ncbi:MAG: hypothetical protein ACI96W_003516, partial [Paraglaciecola sp.]
RSFAKTHKVLITMNLDIIPIHLNIDSLSER